MSAAASLGSILLWDVEGGLPQVDAYLYSEEPNIVAGGLLAVGLVRLLTWASVDVLSEWAGIRIELIWITTHELFILGLILLAGLVASLIPAGMVYKRSLHRGFSS